MRQTVEVWNELGFKFDCISTGFMVNPAQINVIERLISCQDSEKLMVIVDPIMGDDGHLYNGMNEMNVEIMTLTILNDNPKICITPRIISQANAIGIKLSRAVSNLP